MIEHWKTWYENPIAIFGNEIQEKIQTSNIFMVDAVTTDCESSKNFVMMGFCTYKNSKFTDTDKDSINT